MEDFNVKQDNENIIDKVKKTFSKQDKPFTAQTAWVESTYGKGVYKTIEERIADKQIEIKKVIQSKFAQNEGDNTTSIRSSYHCVIDIEEDLHGYEDSILDGLRNAGFEVVDLHEDSKSKSIDKGCYFLSWKHAFQSDRKYQPKEK